MQMVCVFMIQKSKSNQVQLKTFNWKQAIDTRVKLSLSLKLLIYKKNNFSVINCWVRHNNGERLSNISIKWLNLKSVQKERRYINHGCCLNPFRFILTQNSSVHCSCLLNMFSWQEKWIHSRIRSAKWEFLNVFFSHCIKSDVSQKLQGNPKKIR